MELIKYENNMPVLDPNASHKIAEFKRQAELIKANEKELSKALKEEMEAKGIRGVKTPEVSISYVAESYSETFDLERFRLDHPDMYDDYIKIKPKSAFVRIEVKDGD